MLTEERQQMIAHYVDEHQICRVTELCRLTSTSESTIRRDLSEMEDRGLIKRVHGGAQSLQTFGQDVAQQIRFNLNKDDKLAIARLAARKVHPHDYLFLDAGTTIYEMVPFLKEISGLHVVTNGLETALALTDAGIDCCLLGGHVKRQTHAAIGATTVSRLQELNFNAAFIGANALSPSGFLTTPDTEEAAVKRAAIQQSQQAFVLIDRSKFNAVTFAEFAKTDQVTIISRLEAGDREKLPVNIQLEEAK